MKVSELSRDAQRCFAGMFNGCRSRGVIFSPDKSDALMIGKAECEWDWRLTWDELKRAGFIEFEEETVPCYDGGRMVYVHLKITPAGHDARQEDLRLWRIQTDELYKKEQQEDSLR